MLVTPDRPARASVIHGTWMVVELPTAVTANPTCCGGMYDPVLQPPPRRRPNLRLLKGGGWG